MKRLFKVVIFQNEDGTVKQGMNYTIAAYTDVQARDLAVKFDDQLSIENQMDLVKVVYCTVEMIASIDLDIEALPSGFASNPRVQPTRPAAKPKTESKARG